MRAGFATVHIAPWLMPALRVLECVCLSGLLTKAYGFAVARWLVSRGVKMKLEVFP